MLGNHNLENNCYTVKSVLNRTCLYLLHPRRPKLQAPIWNGTYLKSKIF